MTARGRLTVLLTVLVAVAGVVLTALTYLLMRRAPGVRTVYLHLTPGNRNDPAPPPAELLSRAADQLREATLTELPVRAAVALLAVTVLAAAVCWLVAGRILRPVRTISATAHRLSAEHLSERVPVAAPRDELAALAETINGMLDRIERGVAERDRLLAGQRLFTANAAHELRTPLTTMRTALDVTLDGAPSRTELLAMATDVRTALDRTRRTLDGLLALARADAAPEEHPVDLAALAGACAEVPAHLTLHATLGPARTTGDAVLLERMIANLLDNASRYNHPGGEVTLVTGTADGAVFLRVANTGPRVPAEDTERLLAPFVRGHPLRTHAADGAGLGLSIVRAVVTAHRGELTVTAPPLGGLDVRVRLPAA
ncbi:histidine kinase [Actinophytocola xanthii]|uniref:histidine kinase n=1 Tax=Actinophytocola xanthii TaxID=1912961 RepID=A0A1Q8C6H0_9PSEU|nr:histidine kinase [Actinophytocola xanthii]